MSPAAREQESRGQSSMMPPLLLARLSFSSSPSFSHPSPRILSAHPAAKRCDSRHSPISAASSLAHSRPIAIATSRRSRLRSRLQSLSLLFDHSYVIFTLRYPVHSSHIHCCTVSNTERELRMRSFSAACLLAPHSVRAAQACAGLLLSAVPPVREPSADFPSPSCSPLSIPHSTNPFQSTPLDTVSSYVNRDTRRVRQSLHATDGRSVMREEWRRARRRRARRRPRRPAAPANASEATCSDTHRVYRCNCLEADSQSRARGLHEPRRSNTRAAAGHT